MYEMEGPRPAWAALQADDSAALCGWPATGVRLPPSAPVARPFQRSRSFPRGGTHLQW